MMNKQGIIRSFLMVAAIALAVPASAQMGRGGHGDEACSHDGMGKEGHGMMNHRMRDLDLSEAQKDKVFNIMHEQAPKLREKGKAVRKLQEELNVLKTSPNPNEAKVKSLITEIANARAEMDLSRFETERKVSEVLTPEQKKKLEERKTEKKSEMHERHEKRGKTERPVK